MTSSQIFMFGLISWGGILLILLFTSFTSLLSQRLRWQAIAAGRNPETRLADRFLHFFSIPSPPSADEPGGADAPQQPSIPAISNWKWLLLLPVAIGIIIWAEFSLLKMLEEDWNADTKMPIVGFLLAGTLFAFVCRKVEGPSLATRFTAIAPARLAPKFTLWLTNLCLSLIILASIGRELPPWSSYLFLGLWVVNILLFCWNILQVAHFSLPRRDEIREWWRAHYLEVLLIALIGLAALLIRTIDLANYPYAFINDEGEVGMEAFRILRGEVVSFFNTAWAGSPSLAFLPGALSVKLLGNTGVAIRLFSALQGTLAVVFVYLIGREAFDRRTGFLAACILAALPWHVHFSRLGVLNIADSLFTTCSLWLTYRALRRGHFVDYLLAGLVMGLALYTYLGSRLVIPMVIGVLGYAALRQRNYLQTHLRHLAIVVLGFLVVASPIIVAFAQNSDEFMDRLNTESLLIDNRLEGLAANVNMTPFDFMAGQLQSSTMVFIARPGTGQFFSSPRAYLAWWAVIFLVLGMVYTLWHIKEVRYMLLTGWFWAPVIIGGILTQMPPSNQRMLGAAPALALIVALGLWKLANSIRATTRLSANWFMAVCVLFAVFIAWQDIHYYFAGQYRVERSFEEYGDAFSYEVGLRADALNPDFRLRVIGASPEEEWPVVVAASANFYYFSPGVDVQDFNEVTLETIKSLPRDQGIFFAAIPSRVEDLKLIAQQLPGGEWLEVPYRTHEGILYYSYILPSYAPPKR